MKCGECKKTDGLVYTSIPPQVKCLFTCKFHFYDDECDIIADMVEVVRCKDCIHYWKNDPTEVSVCLASPKDDAYCSEGERKK